MSEVRSLAFEKRKGQSIVEIGILLLVIAAAMILMQTYLKRAVQGRLKGSMDSVGGQYDFAAADSEFTIRHVSNQSTITATDTVTRTWLIRPRRITQNVVVSTTAIETHYDNTSREGYEIIPEP